MVGQVTIRFDLLAQEEGLGSPGPGVSSIIPVVLLLGLVAYIIVIVRRHKGTTIGQEVVAANQTSISKGKKRFEKATIGDIILSFILPGWGVSIGVIALCKGEKRRAATMIAIGAAILLLFYLTGGLGIPGTG